MLWFLFLTTCNCLVFLHFLPFVFTNFILKLYIVFSRSVSLSLDFSIVHNIQHPSQKMHNSNKMRNKLMFFSYYFFSFEPNHGIQQNLIALSISSSTLHLWIGVNTVNKDFPVHCVFDTHTLGTCRCWCNCIQNHTTIFHISCINFHSNVISIWYSKQKQHQL